MSDDIKIKIGSEFETEQELRNKLETKLSKLKENLQINIEFNNVLLNNALKNLEQKLSNKKVKLDIETNIIDDKQLKNISDSSKEFEKLKTQIMNLYGNQGQVSFFTEGLDDIDKFTVEIQRADGIIDKFKYKLNSDSEYELIKKSSIDKTSEIIEKQAQQSQEINKRIADENKKSLEKQKKDREDYINWWIAQENKLEEEMAKAREKSNLVSKKQENISETNQFVAQNKVFDDNYKAIENFQKRQKQVLNKISSDYKNIFEPTDIVEFENALSRLSPKSETLEKDFSELEKKIASFKNSLSQKQYSLSLGEVVKTKTPFNFDADSDTLKKYAKEIAGAGAEWTKVIPKVDKFGNQIKEVSIRVKEGGDKWHNYSAILNSSDGTIRKIDKGLSDVSNRMLSLGERFKIAVSSIGLWFGATNLWYGTLHKLQEGIQVINELNKAQTNIMMIANDEVQKYEGGLQGLTNTYSKMAKNLHTTNTEVMKAAEEYLRAGRTIQESQSLLETTTIGSKISGQSAQQTAEQLIAISNGMEIATDRMIDVVDKMSYVDNSSATSFAELATAMQYTSASAKGVGASFDELLSYVGVVSSVSRRSAETIGQAFKTIFARFEDVKQGKTLDLEGESLSNVEQSLNEVGVALRKDKDTFRDFNSVIDDLAKKWKGLTDIQKADLTKSLAGVRQREQLLILLDNYEQVKQVQEGMAESTGSAKSKFDEFYSKSTEARINDVKQSMESFYMTIIKSDTVNEALVDIKSFINTLEIMTTISKESGKALIGLGAAMILMVKNWKSMIGLIGNAIAFFQLLPVALTTSSGATTLLTASFGKLSAVLTTLFMTPAGLIFTGLALAIGVATSAVIGHIKHQKDLQESTENLTNSYNNLTDAMKSNNSVSIRSSVDDLKKQEDIMNDLLKKREELQNKANDVGDRLTPTSNSQLLSIIGEIEKVNKAIEEQKKIMQDAGLTYDENTKKIQELELAKSRLGTNELIEKIEYERDALIKNNDEIINLINEYQQLSEVENLNATQKERLAQISNILGREIDGLIVSKDAEGYVSIQNVSLLGKEIDMRKAEIEAAKTNANVKLENAKNNAQAQIGETNVTYQEITKRIEMYQAEAKAKQALLDQFESKGNLSSSEQYQQLAAFRNLENLKTDLNKLIDAKNKVDAIFNKGASSADFGNGGSKYTPPNSGSSKSDSSSKKEISDLDLKTDRYYKLNNAIKEVENSLDLLKTKESEDDKDNIKNKQEEIRLLQKKQQIENEIYTERLKEQEELKKQAISKGFLFNGDDITNYNEQIKKLTNAANSANEDSKEKAKKDVEEIIKLVDRYTDLTVSEIPNINKQWYETAKSIKEVKNEMKDLAENVVTEYINKIKEIEEMQMNERQEKEKVVLAKTIFDVDEKAWNEYRDKKIKSINEEIKQTEQKLKYDKNNVYLLDQLQAKQIELKLATDNTFKSITDWQSAYDELHQSRIDAIDKEIEAINQKNKQEEFSQEILERQNKLIETQTKLKNIQNEKDVMYIGKSKDGKFDNFYTYDKDEYDETLKDYQEQQKDFSKWITDYADQQRIEELQKQKTYEESLLNAKEQLYNKELAKLETKHEQEKLQFELHYQDIELMTDQWLTNLKQMYGDKWDEILSVMSEKLNSAKSMLLELQKVQAGISTTQSAIESAKISSTSSSSVLDKIDVSKAVSLVNPLAGLNLSAITNPIKNLVNSIKPSSTSSTTTSINVEKVVLEKADNASDLFKQLGSMFKQTVTIRK